MGGADTFEDCDAIFAAAAEANQTVRGHNLCWHTENPGWLNNGNFTPAQLRGVLQSHIHTVVTHYGTRVRSALRAPADFRKLFYCLSIPETVLSIGFVVIITNR